MRTVEIRRHTMRPAGLVHISQAGVDLARRVGSGLGPFELVVTSSLPRAFETAIAMGFAVHRQDERLAMIPSEVEHKVAWNAGFAVFAEAMLQDTVKDYIQTLVSVMQEFVRELSQDGSALVISHGGIVEACVVGCLPEAAFSAWGGYCSYCEGARLTFDGRQCVAGEVLRVKGI